LFTYKTYKMSQAATTKAYALELAEVVMSPFAKQAQGGIEAPMSDENVRLYSAKGGSAVTMTSDTTAALTTANATVIYDPESTLRNGQHRVVIYERNSDEDIIKVSTIAMGRKATDFQAVGVVSSGLKCFNSSGTDVVGGTQSAAVLTSIPRDVSKLTSSDLANFCPNHERDLVSGITSRDDATATISINEHFGKKMALVRPGTRSNLIERFYDDGPGSRRSTTGETYSFTTDTTMTATSATTGLADALASPDDYILVDTNRLKEELNPLTFATYSAKVEVMYRINAIAGSTAVQPHTFRAYALDAANIEIENTSQVVSVAAATNDHLGGFISMGIDSSTKPIHRIIIVFERNTVNQTETIAVQQTTTVVTAYEETSDVPGRPIHICVFEGLNKGATINIASAASMSGIPDSTNVFIGATPMRGPEVYDSNAVDNFLKSVSRVIPRAYTVAGLNSIERQVRALYGDEEVTVAFQAMSFGSLMQKMKKIASSAKNPAKLISSAVLQPAERLADKMATALDFIPGTQAAAAADALRFGSDLSESVRGGDMRKMLAARRYRGGM
jgi:hypothetical protein